MPTLIILRQGQSTYNLENRFTGEVDIVLSAQCTGTRMYEFDENLKMIKVEYLT